MKTLYIHIGTMKTGSTAIQTFLYSNRDYLNKNNFAFPERVFEYPEKPNRRNGTFLAVAADLNGREDRLYDASIVEQQISTIEKCFESSDNVILTEETAWQHITVDRKEAWERLIKRSQEAGIRIKVVVYLRRQDLYIESYWKQAIKYSRYKWSFEHCLEKYPKKIKLDYLSNLDEIAASIGKENIIVRRYQREDLEEGDVVVDFLSIVGLPIDEIKNEILNAESKNISITNNVAAIAVQLNSIPNLSKKDSRRLKPFLLAVSELEGKRKLKTSMFTNEEAIAFVEQFRENNNLLAREYIGDGKPLFNDDYKNAQKWSKDNPYMLVDTIRFVGAAVNGLLDRIDEQEERIKELENARKKNLIRRCIRKTKSIIKGK